MALDTSEVGVSNATGTVETQEVALPSDEPTTTEAPTEIPSGGEPESETPTPESDDSVEDDGEDEGTETGEQTEEQKKLSRRERQRLREQERIDKAVEERIAAREREREAAEAVKSQTEAAQKAREASAKEFAEYIGEEGESDRLNAENAELYDRLRVEIGTLTQEQFDEIDAKIASNKARLSDITKARGFQDKIANNIWNGIDAHIMSPLSWPELSDSATKQRFLTAEGGIAGALGVLKDVLITATEARKDVEIETLKKGHASEVATLREEMRGWRVRAGAEEVPDTTSGGQAISSGGALTPERYARMSFEDRQKLRSTPEGRRQIDEMTRRPGFGQQSA